MKSLTLKMQCLLFGHVPIYNSEYTKKDVNKPDNAELIKQAEYCENECIVMKKFVTSSKQIQQLEADKKALVEALERLASLEAFDRPGIHSMEVKLRAQYAEKAIQKHKNSTQEG